MYHKKKMLQVIKFPRATSGVGCVSACGWSLLSSQCQWLLHCECVIFHDFDTAGWLSNSGERCWWESSRAPGCLVPSWTRGVSSAWKLGLVLKALGEQGRLWNKVWPHPDHYSRTIRSMEVLNVLESLAALLKVMIMQLF